MNLLKHLLHRGCPHRFSWPRVDENGCHYQICLSCGTAYEYDWRKMQRTSKIHAEIAPAGAFLHGQMNRTH